MIIDKIIHLTMVVAMGSMIFTNHLDRIAFTNQLKENEKVLLVVLNNLNGDMVDIKESMQSINSKIENLEVVITLNNGQEK